ncbi:hypothetical protein [Burkholderia glumae]
MKKVIDFNAARKAAEQRKYHDTVLEIYDRMDRTDQRVKRDQASEVRRNARNKL